MGQFVTLKISQKRKTAWKKCANKRDIGGCQRSADEKSFEAFEVLTEVAFCSYGSTVMVLNSVAKFVNCVSLGPGR